MPVLANLFGTPHRVALGMAKRAHRRCAKSASCCLPQGAGTTQGSEGRMGEMAGAEQVLTMSPRSFLPRRVRISCGKARMWIYPGCHPALLAGRRAP